MTTSPNSLITPQTPATSFATVTLAKTALTGSNTGAVRLLPAASVPNGARIIRLFAIPNGSTTSAIQLQVYRSPDAGVTLVNWESASMAQYTYAATESTPKTDFGYSEASITQVQAGEELWAGIGVAASSGINFFVEYQAF